MRKYGLLVVVAGLALSASVAEADFWITSSRVVNGNGTDTVTFQVQDSSSGNTAGLPLIQSASIALYAPTTRFNISFPDNGLFISASSGAANVTSGSRSIIAISGIPQLQATPSILSLTGVVDSTGSVTYTDGQKVAAIGLALGTITAGVDATTAPITFAVAVVPYNDPVGVLQTTSTADAPGNRTFFPTFEHTATEFGAHAQFGTVAATYLQASNNVIAYFDGDVVPEPASLSVVGIGVASLVARRRRT